MLRGLWKLTWIEIKVFLREPMGAFGSVGLPVLLFIAMSGLGGGNRANSVYLRASSYLRVGLPVFVAVLAAVSAVLSLITIIAIYREGGILKRLRATPLRPQTILSAHVMVKLILTAVTMALLVLVGKRYSVGGQTPLFSFTIALLICTWSILSIGFVIASLVPTARFAQPVGAMVLYPMIALSGIFIAQKALPPVMRWCLGGSPFTYAVPLLQGIWDGESWWRHLGDVAGLVAVFLVFTAVAAKVFRWE